MMKELGRVREVFLGFGDRGLFTFMIDFDFERGTSQAFGNYCLDEWNPTLQRRAGTASGLDLIMQLCQAFGVDDLHKAKGKTVWVLREPGSELIVGVRSLGFDLGGRGQEFTISAWRNAWFLADGSLPSKDAT